MVDLRPTSKPTRREQGAKNIACGDARLAGLFPVGFGAWLGQCHESLDDYPAPCFVSNSTTSGVPNFFA